MPTIPVGGGNEPPDVTHYANLLELKYPGWLSGTDNTKTLSMMYIQYMDEHPHANAQQVYMAVIARLNEVSKLPGTIGQSVNGVGTVIGKVVKGTGAGLGKAAQTLDPFHGLNLQTLMLRVGEVLLGLVMLGVAVAHLTGSENVISRGVKIAGKAAML
jgi:hypothetical protein